MGRVLPKEDLNISTSCEDLRLCNLKSFCNISHKIIIERSSPTKRRGFQAENITDIAAIRAVESNGVKRDLVVSGLIHGLQMAAPETTWDDTYLSHK